MQMVCERCWERRCRCSPAQREADRQKIIAEFAKAEGLPEGWQPGVDEQAAQRERAAQELADQAQELKMGYE